VTPETSVFSEASRPFLKVAPFTDWLILCDEFFKKLEILHWVVVGEKRLHTLLPFRIGDGRPEPLTDFFFLTIRTCLRSTACPGNVNIVATSVSSDSASASMVSNDGWLIPRSIKLMKSSLTEARVAK